MNESFQTLEAQLIRVIEAGDYDQLQALLKRGADAFRPIALAELSADVRERVLAMIAAKVPSGGESGQ